MATHERQSPPPAPARSPLDLLSHLCGVLYLAAALFRSDSQISQIRDFAREVRVHQTFLLLGPVGLRRQEEVMPKVPV